MEASVEWSRTKLCSIVSEFLISKKLLFTKNKPSTVSQRSSKTSTRHLPKQKQHINLTPNERANSLTRALEDVNVKRKRPFYSLHPKSSKNLYGRDGEGGGSVRRCIPHITGPSNGTSEKTTERVFCHGSRHSRKVRSIQLCTVHVALSRCFR